MEANFWHQRWASGDIGFHEGQANALLVAHFDKLNLAAGERVFLPLCGKTRDIAWLLARGYRVVGIELSTRAIDELFSELGVEPHIERVANMIHYSAQHIDILVGNLFDLSIRQLGPVNAVYDRGALVALPAALRQQYADHIQNITNTARQLLITYEYDPAQMDGPPFSVAEAEVKQLYASSYILSCIERKHVEGRLKGKVVASENAWRLERSNE